MKEQALQPEIEVQVITVERTVQGADLRASTRKDLVTGPALACIWAAMHTLPIEPLFALQGNAAATVVLIVLEECAATPFCKPVNVLRVAQNRGESAQVLMARSTFIRK